MKKIKAVAGTLVVSFGLTIASPVAMPLWAADQAVATTTADRLVANNTFTLDEIQKMMVSKNRTANVMALNLKILEENRMIVGNNSSELFDQIYNANYPSFDTSGLDKINQAIAALEAGLVSNPNDPAIKAQLVALNMQKTQIQSSMSSAMGSVSGSVSAMLDQQEVLDDQYEAMGDNKADLEKKQKDWENEVKMVAQALFIKATEFENTAKLLEKQHQLAIELEKLEDVKKDLGISTEVEQTGKKISVTDAFNQMSQMQSAVANLKRQINDLTGRALNAPLYLTPIALPTEIDSAPIYTQKLVDQVTAKNYKLKTLERDLSNADREVKDNTGSNEKAIVDRQKDLKKIEIQDQKVAIQNDIKAKLQQINTTGTAYRSAMLTYDKETKNHTYAQTKLALGMISPLEYKNAEMALLNAEIARDKAGYQHYLARQEYTAMLNGVDMTTYNSIKGM